MKWIRVQGKKKLTPGVCRYRWPETEKWEYQINDPFNISHLYGKEVEIIDESTPPEKTYSEEEVIALIAAFKLSETCPISIADARDEFPNTFRSNLEKVKNWFKEINKQ